MGGMAQWYGSQLFGTVQLLLAISPAVGAKSQANVTLQQASVSLGRQSKEQTPCTQLSLFTQIPSPPILGWSKVLLYLDKKSSFFPPKA